MQPTSAPGMWNMSELRPLEGFVFALTPFNFTAIGGNLPTAPALMGNTVVWKPAETPAARRVADRSSCSRRRACRRASSTSSPASRHDKTNILLDHPELAGIHFTGSTDVFRMMWKRVADNLDRYKSYPRLVGETGGKDFILAHPSADPKRARDRDRARRLRVPGPEVLGGVARVRRAVACGTQMKDELVDDDRHAQGRRRLRLLELHGRGDQEGRVRQARRRDRRGARDRAA